MFLFMIEWMIDQMHSYCISVQNNKLKMADKLKIAMIKAEDDAVYASQLAEKLEPMKRNES
jgi:hypothetical protein